MQKPLFNFKFMTIIMTFFLGLFLYSHAARADDSIEKNDFYLDKTQVVNQQIDLLKNRIVQAKNEYADLKNQQENPMAGVSADHVNKQWLNWTKLDISVAKSNLDSIDIEVSEAEQMTALLEKDTKELTNQMNVYTIFGSKISRNGVPNVNNMRAQLAYQKNLLHLEKERLEYLYDLRSISDKILQIYNTKYSRIETLLKSQTMMQLKERQAKNEIDFQQQQDMWLQHLNGLNAQLRHLEQSGLKDRAAYIKLENEIFYANENVNFMYLQMLIVRYQDQIQQLKLSNSRGSSITLLNKVSDQAQALGKQFARVKHLLAERMRILEDRKTFLVQEALADESYLNEVSDLDSQYKAAVQNVLKLSSELIEFRATLDRAIQEELSSRQGLLGFGVNAWLDLGSEILLLPTLTYEVGKSLIEALIKIVTNATISGWSLFGMIELVWGTLFYLLSRYLSRVLCGIPDRARGHTNLKWLIGTLSQRNLLDAAIIGNLVWFFSLSGISVQYFRFLLDLGFVWLLFKSLIIVTKLCFIETVHDRASDDVQIYHRLKWTFLFGGIITAVTVFLAQLPVIYELKDLFCRLFLLFLAIVSIFLLRSSDVLSGLVLPHIDDQRTYFKKIIRLLTILLPLALLFNSLIGLFGFLNFVLTISWYESIFFLVLAGYLIVKGLLNELIDFVSEVLINHAKNGWIWTEALLKPIDRILRILLFLAAWVVLFFLYGWDQQSPVVESLSKLLYYPLANVLGTTITFISITELIVITFFLYWAARWIREFVYRMMSSRTTDLGIRTSIAILSQYTLILSGILIGLRLLGIDLKALTFIVSAFALGVGLGLRDIANNFVCGFLLLFERPLRVGDTVCINGFEGDVIHIGGRAVTIRTFDHMEVMVPNSDIFSKIFTNWTAHDHIVRTVVSIKINRHDSPQVVQSLIYQVLAEDKNVLSDPAPEVYLKELAEGLVEFEVRYYINLRYVKSRTSVRSEVLMAIWNMFEKTGIKAPYPHHEVYVSSHPLPLLAPPLKTEIDNIS
jgi:potassium-dependent mechanosensitive channel